MPERVFITGLGAVSPLGLTLEDIWDRLETGRHPFGLLSGIETGPYKSHRGAEVGPFSCDGYIDPNLARRLDRVSQMSVIAAMKAVQDAGLDSVITESPRVGIVMGTGLGSTSYTDEFFVGLVQKGPASANPMLFPNTVPNAAASYISILLKLRGPNTTFSHKEISAEQAVAYALRQLKLGHADVLLVGGAEEISSFLFHAFSVTKSLAPRNPELPEMMMPYDRKRNGLVLGEGAAVLVLEREGHVRQRQGKVYAEILEAELASENVGIIGYHPQGRDLWQAIQKIRAKNPQSMDQIDLVSGGANSTTLLDQAEARVISNVNAETNRSIPLLALKSYTGCFHGGGALRLLLAVLIMQRNIVPPTTGLTDPLIQPGIDFVMTEKRAFPVSSVLHCATSYGGTSCAILLKKVT